MDNLGTARRDAAKDIGLTETEYAFYNIMMAELTGGDDTTVLDDDQLKAVKETTQKLVMMFDETTQIVDVFNKPDQIKTMKKSIKRAVVDQPFYSAELNNALQERFIELAKTKYRRQGS